MEEWKNPSYARKFRERRRSAENQNDKSEEK
jgi:hypothetical protein